ncbi:MAG: insulinase family protein, partial [Atopostipes sp.]|nr:insulinase family protein [Atopostipes sp.]
MTFKKTESQELNDIQSTGHLYTHEETGAQVLHLKNNDPNKAFTIAFKTPPYSDNGITHILEHSVLNGSKKYPSKEPFVELIKGSLNTFVNAMTFPDKTIYPVASTNQKDFRHLMGVYLDAVFQPAFIENPQILAQEGWHYHLEDPSDDLIYKGVVYNEMKGATASPERQLNQEVTAKLYPDSLYAFESGGDPKAIPTLTQEEFVRYHTRYYHPSNSMTILYGDLDLEKAFEDLEEYFSGKGKLEETVDLAIEIKEPKKTYYEKSYSITEGDDPANKDFLALAWHTALPTDILDGFGLSILEEILLGNNQAPLKKALLDAEIGGDINGGTTDIGYPRAFMVSAKYSDAEKIDAFKKVTENTLKDLVKEGIDEELIEAALNKVTFETKEMAISEDNPRGVLFAITALSSWLYDEDPFINLDFSKYLDELAEKAKSRYFEKLIQEKLLNNPIRIELALKADPGKNDRLEAEVQKKLADYQESLSNTEINKIVEKTKALIKRQNTPDKAEDLAKIPRLSREDLTTDVPEYPLDIRTLFKFNNGQTDFYHAEQFTAGIDYLDLYFDIRDLPQEDYSLLSYLAKILTHLETENYDVAKLQSEINTHTGGIHGKISIFEDDEGLVQPYFVLSA